MPEECWESSILQCRRLSGLASIQKSGCGRLAQAGLGQDDSPPPRSTNTAATADPNLRCSICSSTLNAPAIMDPVTVLGIVNAAANLGLKCVTIIHSLHTASERFKTADLSILSLVEECSTIELAWDQLRLYVQSELAHVPGNEHIVHRIQRSLHAGELVISALQKDLDDALSAPLKSSLLQRTKVVWKEDTLKDHQSRIRGQVGALTLLLQVIKLYVPDRGLLLLLDGDDGT